MCNCEFELYLANENFARIAIKFHCLYYFLILKCNPIFNNEISLTRDRVFMHEEINKAVYSQLNTLNKNIEIHDYNVFDFKSFVAKKLNIDHFYIFLSQNMSIECDKNNKSMMKFYFNLFEELEFITAEEKNSLDSLIQIICDYFIKIKNDYLVNKEGNAFYTLTISYDDFGALTASNIAREFHERLQVE
ncbi:hypothetical protein COBT_000250 [Conglomerata obtusa]